MVKKFPKESLKALSSSGFHSPWKAENFKADGSHLLPLTHQGLRVEDAARGLHPSARKKKGSRYWTKRLAAKPLQDQLPITQRRLFDDPNRDAKDYAQSFEAFAREYVLAQSGRDRADALTAWETIMNAQDRVPTRD